MTKAFAPLFNSSTNTAPSSLALELVCPVNNLATLKAAVDNGADCVRLVYRDTRDERCFAGRRFNSGNLIKGLEYAGDHGRKVMLEMDIALGTSDWGILRRAIDHAARSGVNAIALSDAALMLYVADRVPGLRLYYLASEAVLTCEALEFLQRQFGVSRVILPGVLSLEQIRHLSANTNLELEVFGFGLSCAIVTARESAASNSVSNIRNRNPCMSANRCNIAMESCAGMEIASNDSYYSLEAMHGINTLKLLPQLNAMGVRAVKVEALHYGAAQLAQVARVWRAAIDECLENSDHYSVKPSWIAKLDEVTKGR